MSTKIVKDVNVIYLKDADTVTSSEAGDSFNAQNFNEMLIFVKTANSGGTSPTLDIKVQTQDPKTNDWVDTGITVAQITGDGNFVGNHFDGTNYFPIPFGRNCRLYHTIGGTSPTFDITTTVVLKS